MAGRSVNWTGGGNTGTFGAFVPSSDFASSASWGSNTPPGTADSAIFQSATNTTVTGTGTVATVTVDDAAQTYFFNGTIVSGQIALTRGGVTVGGTLVATEQAYAVVAGAPNGGFVSAGASLTVAGTGTLIAPSFIQNKPNGANNTNSFTMLAGSKAFLTGDAGAGSGADLASLIIVASGTDTGGTITAVSTVGGSGTGGFIQVGGILASYNPTLTDPAATVSPYANFTAQSGAQVTDVYTILDSFSQQAGSLTIAGGGTGPTTWVDAGGTVNNSTITRLGFMTVGAGEITGSTPVAAVGASTLTVTGSASLTDTNAFIGENKSGRGVALVGGGALWTISNTFFVGDNGNGTLTVSDPNSTVAANIVSVGRLVAGVASYGTFGTGALTITNGGTLTATTQVIVGEMGNGALVVNGGTTASSLTTGALVAGFSAGSVGSVTIGGNSTLTTTGSGASFIIGAGGAGSLRETDSSSLINAAAGVVFGNVAGGVGIGTVSNGSTLSVGANLFVGYAGIGSLTTSGTGSKVTVIGSANIGRSAGSAGSMTVGSGGAFGALGPLYVANLGTGSLTISDLTSNTNIGGATYIGNGVTANGTQFFGDTNTTAVVGGIGTSFSSGTLSIANGATFSSQGIIFDGSAGRGTVSVADATSLLSAKSLVLGVNSGTLSASQLIAQGQPAPLGSLQLTNGTIALSNLFRLGSAGYGSGQATISGGTVSSNALIVGNGTLSVSGGAVAVAGTANTGSSGLIAVRPGGTVTIGTGALARSGAVSIASNLTGAGTLAADLLVSGAGSVQAANGSLLVTGKIDSAGTIGIAAGATFDDEGGVRSLNAVDFLTNTGTFIFNRGQNNQLVSTIVEFAAGDTIDIRNAFNASTTLTATQARITYDGLTDVLSFSTAVTPGLTATMSGSDILLTVACFAEGTRITTDQGDIAVETLRAGQRVRTLSGAAVPVVWMGHRRIDTTRYPDPARVMPVRIRAGALGEGLPSRDLLLSPEHAVYCDGVLIPARLLINDRTVTQDRVAEIGYFHIELARHDIVFANGLPAESWLDTGNRGMFANAPVADLVPNFGGAEAAWAKGACAPLCEVGPRLDAVRARLADRADTIDRAELSVVADGRLLTGTQRPGGQWRFNIPACSSMSIRVAEGRAIERLRWNGVILAPTDARFGEEWAGMARGGSLNLGGAGVLSVTLQSRVLDLAG